MGEPKAIPGHRYSEERSLLIVPRRRDWDPAKRRAAWEFDQSAPGWSVFYGTYTRLFFAIAAWPSSSLIVLEAHDIPDLRRQIQEAETTHLHQGGHLHETKNAHVLPHGSQETT